jgi:hypothetical protein
LENCTSEKHRKETERPCRLPELPDADALGRKRVTPPHMAKGQGKLAFTEFLCVSTRQHRRCSVIKGPQP